MIKNDWHEWGADKVTCLVWQKKKKAEWNITDLYRYIFMANVWRKILETQLQIRELFEWISWVWKVKQISRNQWTEDLEQPRETQTKVSSQKSTWFKIELHIFCWWLCEPFTHNKKDVRFSDSKHFVSYGGY